MTALTTLTLAAALSVSPAPAAPAGHSIHAPAARAALDRLVASAEPALRERAVHQALEHGLGALQESTRRQIAATRPADGVMVATDRKTASWDAVIR